MAWELVIRFLVGGAVVTAFSLVGEVTTPKTFSGLFGAAPSVSIATLGLTFAHDGASTVATEARWMVIAAAAQLAYCAACVFTCRRPHVPVWAGAAGAWFVWLALAAGAYVAIGWIE